MNSCKGKSAAKGGILSKLNNLFSTSNPAVKKLMKWKQYDEDDTWAEKAIESLVKKLKNKKGALQELERALTSPGIPTRCVTIPKSRDGRLQVSHKKVLPNVISCRIWRWPDLQINSELEPVSYCQYPYSKKLKEICINPYHYERVESKILPPVLVPRYNYVHGYTSPPYQEPRRYMPHNVVYSENGFSAHKSNSRSTSSGHASSSGCSTSYYGQNSAHSSNSCSTSSGQASSSGCSTSYCGQNSAHSSNSCSTSSGHASSSGCSTSYCGQNAAHSSNSCSTSSGYASSSGCSTSYCGQNAAHSSNSCSTSSGYASSSGCSTSYCGQNAAHSSNSCSTSSGHASSSGCSTSYCGQNSAHSSNSCSTSSGQASYSGCSTSYCGQNAAHSSNSCSTSSGHASSSGCSTSYCGQNAAHSWNSCSTSSGHASSSGCSTSYCGQNAANSSNSCSTSSGHASSSGCSTSYCGENSAHSSNSCSTSSEHASSSGCSTSYYGQNSAHSSNSCSTSSGQASSSGCSTSYCGQNSAHSSNSCSTSSGHASSSGSSTSYCGQNSYRTYSAQKNFSACRSIYENYTNSDNFPNEQQYLSADLQPVVYQEQQIWCSIAYYEFNFRVGDLFTCPSPSIIVDGFSNPNRNSYRFCLGQLSNVKRTSFVEAVRQRIGEGVLLYYGGGKVHMRNLSNSAIFMQSRNLNQQQNFHVSTVCKIPAGYSSPLEIFNNLAFAEELSKCVHYGFDAVYELRKTCTIRLSFVKGWGKEYQRDDITGIPCWIEVHLHGPLKWLDRVVEQMGGSAVPISSVS